MKITRFPKIQQILGYEFSGKRLCSWPPLLSQVGSNKAEGIFYTTIEPNAIGLGVCMYLLEFPTSFCTLRIKNIQNAMIDWRI